jgi:ADP-heptose:LPS heptosyltransferase
MAKKVLIIRLGAIGDVVHSSIIQQALKAKYPDTVIHFMTAEFIAPLIENDINLDKVFSVDKGKENNLLYLTKLGLKLRKEKYDAIFCLTSSARNFYICLLSGAKTIVKRAKQGSHAAECFFNSAKQIFPDIEMPAKQKIYLKDVEKIKNKIQNYPKPHIVINAGAEADKNRQGRILPLKTWIESGNKIIEAFGGTIFLCGSEKEKAYQEPLKEIPSSVSFTGELSLTESAALYELSDLVISGDSGPMHIAAALDTTVIGIMGSTHAGFCGPYGNYTCVSKYECVACGQKYCEKLSEGEIYTPCMQDITSDRIFDTVKKVL